MITCDICHMRLTLEMVCNSEGTEGDFNHLCGDCDQILLDLKDQVYREFVDPMNDRLADLIGDHKAQIKKHEINPKASYKGNRKWTKRALQNLFNMRKTMSRQEVADHFGLSTTRIYQLEKKAEKVGL